MQRAAMFAAFALFLPALAHAHHEAIFGPQSAMVLSSDTYLTAQVFTRQTGPKGDRTQETTTVLSTGFSPKGPLSISVIVPFSVLSTNGVRRTGLEDAIVGVRYRADLPGVTNTIGGRESFAMAVGGVELPTGTLDHDFGNDSLASIVAGLLSVEKGPFSVIGYSFYRRQAAYRGAQEGANVFVGGGLAWTPIDADDRLVSVQLGLSYEATLKERLDQVEVTQSGGSGTFVHPTLIYGFSQQLLLFAQTSLPLRQDWRDVGDEERFRFGAGVILALGR